MSFKRYIPEKYTFEFNELVDAVQKILGTVPITLQGRIIIIDAEVPQEKMQLLKTSVLNVLEDNQSIEV